MRRRSVVKLAILLLATVVAVDLGTVRADERAGNQEADQPEESEGVRPYDEICGPRCAEYVLDFFGKQVDVIELVREMQWPDIERGATLRAVAESLEKRGVSAFPMQIVPEARLKWPYPVIVHIDEKSEGLGHFVVWLPSSSGGKVRVWCGVNGNREIRQADWARQHSGAVLLTAPTPIDNPEAALEKAGSFVSRRMMIAIMTTVVVAIGFFVSRTNPRCFSCSFSRGGSSDDRKT